MNVQHQVVESFWSLCCRLGIPLTFVAWNDYSYGEQNIQQCHYIYRQNSQAGELSFGFCEPVHLSWVHLMAAFFWHMMDDQQNDLIMAAAIHEIRNPLAVMSGYQEVLAQTYADPLLDKMDEYMVRVTERLDDVFIGYKRAIRLENFDLTALCHEVAVDFRLFVDQRQITITVEGDPAWVRADRQQMHQVLRNLVHNAVDAVMPQGKIEIATYEHDDHMILRVADDGTGINDAVLPFLFHPYYTSKIEGHGLGLVICQRIVQNHHGSIDIVNLTPGTAFVVSIPKMGR